jgi:hypothetical protein
MQEWNRQTANDLRKAYKDTLSALVAEDALGKGYRRVLAEPLLDEVSGFPEALRLR